MPVWGAVADGRIIFSTGPDTIKAKNLRRDPAMVMHLESGDDVVIVEARAESITGDALPANYVPAYATKYGFEIDLTEPGYAFWELHPEVALVWDEAEFVDTAVRFQF